MKVHHLKPPPGAHRAKTRKGRGEAAGKGKTAGRGTKGTGARGTVPAGFEGGQMPLQRRLPKLPGFTPRNRVEYQTVNVAKLADAFADGDTVTPDALRARGLVRRGKAPVKVLGNGDLGKRLTVNAHAFSASAKAKIEADGGAVEVMDRRGA
ncbi:MAG: 50S ribosomal protein L15 [Euzebyales bacterium]|jgi:large subunit ribosomal protein L15|nr:50S ribosomal protein L15 [Euzebyales bacterium]